MGVFVTFINVINKFGINNAYDPFGSEFIDLSATNFTVPRTQREMGVSAGIAGGKGFPFI